MNRKDSNYVGFSYDQGEAETASNLSEYTMQGHVLLDVTSYDQSLSKPT